MPPAQGVELAPLAILVDATSRLVPRADGYASPVDRLTRLRAPLAAVALAALTLVAAARVGLGLSELVSVGGSQAVAAARLAPNGDDAALTVLVGVLVASCYFPSVVPSRRRLAVWGVVLTAVSLVATFVAFALTDLVIAGWGLVWGVPDLAVPALVGAGLLVLARPDPATAADPHAVAADPRTAAVAVPPADPPDPELQPSWTQDTAAGAVWRTAGDAARGAPAQAWGPADAATWPIPAPPALTALPAPPTPPARPAALPFAGSEQDDRTDRS